MKTQKSDLEQINDQVLTQFRGRKQRVDIYQLYHLPQVSKFILSVRLHGKLISLWRVESDMNYRKFPRGSFFVIYNGTLCFDNAFGFVQYVEEIGILYRLPYAIQGQILDRSVAAMKERDKKERENAIAIQFRN